MFCKAIIIIILHSSDYTTQQVSSQSHFINFHFVNSDIMELGIFFSKLTKWEIDKMGLIFMYHNMAGRTIFTND